MVRSDAEVVEQQLVHIFSVEDDSCHQMRVRNQSSTCSYDRLRRFPLIRSDNAAPTSLSGSTKVIRTPTWRAPTSCAESGRTNAAPHFIHACPERARMRNVPCIAVTSWTQ